MDEIPYTFGLLLPSGVPTKCGNHIIRKLSSMKEQYADDASYSALLSENDVVVYEVYETNSPEAVGELRHGISIVHPGKVGDEYFMTKGHFHRELETAEVYVCLQGSGMMVMETPEGDWSVQELTPGEGLYVTPRWAHRSVNVSAEEDLVTFFVYPAHAGHDYRTIERRGFRKLVVEQNNEPQIVDNPRWRAEP